MSIAEKTISALVGNRVHDIADIVLDMNIKQGRCARLFIMPGGVAVREDADQAYFSAPLPPAVLPSRALDGLEQMISDLRDYQKRGANQ